MQITFVEAKETKGTFKFEEIIGSMAEPKIGTLYVRKNTLKELGWEPGTPLTIVLKKGE